MLPIYKSIFGVAVGLLLFAHPADAVHLVENAKSSLQKQATSIPVTDGSQQKGQTLLLPRALALALTQNPRLNAFSWETRAKEAAALQARLLPNPEFGANAQNFGNGRAKGFDGDAVTLQLSQLIELGGKRSARTKAAELNKTLADWDYLAQRADVLAQVSLSFIDVLAAQRRLALTRQTHTLAEQVMMTSSARVQAGKVSPVEATKARLALASVQVDLLRAQRELQATRKQLAATWGNSAPDFEAAAGDLDAVEPPPELAALSRRLADNPDWARWATEIHQRQAVIAVEKAKAIPDVTAYLGGSNYIKVNDYVMNVGFSVPLPVFNRNQGGIRAAEHRLSRAEEERASAKLQIETALNTAYQKLDAAYAEVKTLNREILPGAQSAYDAAKEGYRLGKFNFLEVLDAQRTLFSAKKQQLTALADYHKAVIEVERLIGGDLTENDTQPEPEALP